MHTTRNSPDHSNVPSFQNFQLLCRDFGFGPDNTGEVGTGREDRMKKSRKRSEVGGWSPGTGTPPAPNLPPVTHPDALHHGDVLILVRLKGDPAGAGCPAHGCRCRPYRQRARTGGHWRPHAHTRACKCWDSCSAGARPRPRSSKEKAPVSSSRLLRLRATTNGPRVGQR